MEETVKEWFKLERGIDSETLADFGIHQEGDMIIFPYPEGEKSRYNPTIEGKRRFTFSGKMGLFTAPLRSGSKSAIIVEGETDTLRLFQALRESPVDVYGLSGVEAWMPHYADQFEHYEKVWVILDNDEDYKTQGRTDNCWKQIRMSIGRRANRVILPGGVKDICEFYSRFSPDLLIDLLKRKNASRSKYKRLDLTKEPPAMNWLVEGLICQGDVNLLVGNPSLGKSWLMKDLSIAVAGGKDSWLGREIKHNGKVLYIDEENPEDIIYHRFKKLGLTQEHAGNIHYLYRPGIWINKEPETLIDEALEIDPVLIVIDSLSRVHSEDENSANAMAKLFREGITPLARETNAAVVVIHHTIKGDSDSSFQRARGSGDLTAVVDTALDVRGSSEADTNTLSVYKSRRTSGRQIIPFTISDVGENVELIASKDLPF